MERLQDMVTTMRRKVDSHVLILHRERPAHTAMDWVPENGRRKRGGRRTHGEPHSMKTSEKWVSAGMEPAGSPVTVRYMEASRRPMLREEQEDLTASTASVAEWLRQWDTLTIFETTVCGRS